MQAKAAKRNRSAQRKMERKKGSARDRAHTRYAEENAKRDAGDEEAIAKYQAAQERDRERKRGLQAERRQEEADPTYGS